MTKTMTLTRRKIISVALAAITCGIILSLEFFGYNQYYFHHWCKTYDSDSPKNAQQFFAKRYISTNWERLSVVNGTKYILWFGDHGLSAPASLARYGCRVNNCKFTNNETMVPYNQFAAFVIQQQHQRSPWILKNRRPDQMFITLDVEPPGHVPDLVPFSDYYNWTMTYRSDSDFPFKYGDVVPLETAPNTEEEAATMRRNFLRWPGINPARGKTKGILWVVSNCKAESNRQEYVRILRKFIDVDIFSESGRCGGRDGCPRESKISCHDFMENNYKFYLSFENSICKDYVTEKFYEIMARNIVPIVLGGANYSAIAPSHSYINALDYTPRKLAAYLTMLDRNDSLYSEYFWWKPHYSVFLRPEIREEPICNLCEALHSLSNGSRKSKTIPNLHKWLKEDANCKLGAKFQED